MPRLHFGKGTAKTVGSFWGEIVVRVLVSLEDQPKVWLPQKDTKEMEQMSTNLGPVWFRPGTNSPPELSFLHSKEPERTDKTP